MLAERSPPPEEHVNTTPLGNGSAAIIFHSYSTVSWVNGAVYSVLFVFVYAQMWMILFYGHKRLSYQTVFLFTCLVWSALRVAVFSIDYSGDSAPTNRLPTCLYWILFCLPVCLQYVILVLLLVFFSQVLLTARSRLLARKYKSQAMMGGLGAVLTFSTTNMVCTALSRPPLDYDTSKLVVLIRVCVNDSLFIVTGALLSYCIVLLGRLRAAGSVLRAKGKTLCQAYVACAFIILLYVSKAGYNVATVAVSHRKSSPWLHVSEQAELVSLHEDYNLAVFGVVLLIWEALPTVVVVLFFRVQRPIRRSSSGAVASDGGQARQINCGSSDGDVANGELAPSTRLFNKPRLKSKGVIGSSTSGQSAPYRQASSAHTCYGATERTHVHRAASHSPTTPTRTVPRQADVP